MRKYKNTIASLLIAALAFTSCSDIFDVDPEEVLLHEDYLGDDELDARAAIFGVLSLMQDQAQSHFVWGELRGDLVEPTEETEENLRKIMMHELEEENPYLDPTNLFAIINNCNFAMTGIDTVAYDNAMVDEYVSLLRIRSWAQLQVAINYGKLPWITKPIESNEDLENDYPLLDVATAMDSMIVSLLPFQDVPGINDEEYTGSQGGTFSMMIPDQNVLLGEMYLWRGDYANAATHYKNYLDVTITSSGSAYNLGTAYDILHSENAGEYSSSIGHDNIFGSSSAEAIFNTVYVDAYKQFNDLYTNLKGQAKASTAINMNWSVQKNIYEGVTFADGDFRRAVLFSDQIYDELTGELTTTSYKLRSGFYKFDRVARVYLRLAEAINKAGYPAHALNLLNHGFINEKTPTPQFTGNAENFLNYDLDKYYEFNSGGMITSGNKGIRGRAGLESVKIEGALNKADSITIMDELILNENALELAFEGTRWVDLVRSAQFNQDPAIVANAIAAKFFAAGETGTAELIRQKLLDPQNWYLPLSMEE